MELNFEKRGGIPIVRISGELDHHFSEEIRRRIDNEVLRSPFRHVLFDFNGLSFMDSSGIGMLMGRYRTIAHLGGKAWIICNNSRVARILEMSGVFQYIHREDSLESALQKCQAG